MYLVKTPKIIQDLFPNLTWRIPVQEKVLFLTFDDGPVPEATPWVLEQLKSYGAKATFFCVGDNVRKHPDIFELVKNAGHTIGNHSYNHLNGWETDNLPYFHNVRRCAELVHSTLFRPPYGKLKPRQIQFLQRHYQIVMWDVLSGDFDSKLNGKQCFENVVQKGEKGSIIVFHDSPKSWERLQYALPKTLDFFLGRGFRFNSIQDLNTG